LYRVDFKGKMLNKKKKPKNFGSKQQGNSATASSTCGKGRNLRFDQFPGTLEAGLP
jgi:hypothetical protein